MKNRVHGMTLIELLVSTLIAVIIGSALVNLTTASYNSESYLMDQNAADALARKSVDLLADGWKASGSTVTTPGIRGADSLANSIDAHNIYYNCHDSNGVAHVVHYWISNNNLMRTVDGLPNGGSTAINNISTLTFNYWTWNGSSWLPSTTPAAPANVGVVDYSITSNQNGKCRTYSGSIRIRQQRCTINANGNIF
jgi:type II secretory pathway pseudopilin PulG